MAAPPSSPKRPNRRGLSRRRRPAMEATACAAAKKAKVEGPDPVDLISLPDDLLGDIITLLPTGEAARTTVLSRRWRHLWRSSPLNLDEKSFPWYYEKRLFVASKILSEHQGPVRCLKINHIDYPDFDGLFRSAALDNLQEIDVSIPGPMPLSVLRFAPTLRAASFDQGSFLEEDAPPSFSFPNMRKLAMNSVAVREDTLHSVLSGSPVLESLLLDHCSGISRLRINSATLRSLGVCDDGRKADLFGCDDPFQRIDEIVIEDAPLLERLIRSIHFFTNAIIRVIRAPKLEILGPLPDDIAKLKLPIAGSEEMTDGSLNTAMRSVKVLHLTSCGYDLGAIFRVLKFFPCLEKLYITSDLKNCTRSSYLLNPQDPIECLDTLKEVVLKCSTVGKKPEVNLAKFFVLNAKVLELMRFSVQIYGHSVDLKQQQRLLRFDSRASPNARFDVIVDHACRNNLHILSMVDPFGESCEYCGQAY